MPVLELDEVTVRYRAGRDMSAAVDRVSLTLQAGETLAVVGESGCGKSTLAKAIVGLVPLHAGRIELAGIDVSAPSARRRREFRRSVQMVFQDPYGSLNPRMTIRQTLDEALRIHTDLVARDRGEEVVRLLSLVALDASSADRLPARFSGGQRQRIAIARALATRPRVLIADEITSALDVSVQASVINLLKNLQAETGIAMVFITHNLAISRYIAARTAVMQAGRVIEVGGDDLYDNPTHPYTRTLLAAAPRI